MEIKDRLGLCGAKLCLTSFVACQHPAESCGHNGLPLTPNSIAILGQAESLKTLEHPHLCSYLDFRRGKQERVVCVSEYYEQTLENKNFSDPLQLMDVASQVLLALQYLETKKCIVVNVSSRNILINPKGEIKLFNYGMGQMTEYGKLVSFPLFDPRTVAPEILLEGPLTGQSVTSDEELLEETADSIQHILPASDPPYTSSCSVWSLSMVLFAKAIGLNNEYDYWPNLKISQILRKVTSFDSSQDIVTRLAREFNCDNVIAKLPHQILDFFRASLNPNSSQRASIQQLLTMLNQNSPSCYENHYFPTMKLRCEKFSSPPMIEDYNENENPIDALTLQEIYYIWHLAGGDIMGEIRRHGLMVSLPPILTYPKILLNEGHAVGQLKERCTLYDPKVMILQDGLARSCLKGKYFYLNS